MQLGMKWTLKHALAHRLLALAWAANQRGDMRLSRALFATHDVVRGGGR